MFGDPVRMRLLYRIMTQLLIFVDFVHVVVNLLGEIYPLHVFVRSHDPDTGHRVRLLVPDYKHLSESAPTQRLADAKMIRDWTCKS